MNKLLTAVILMLSLATSVFAQGYGGYNDGGDSVHEDQDDFPSPQPTPVIDVPPPTGEDDGDYNDYSGTESNN